MASFFSFNKRILSTQNALCNSNRILRRNDTCGIIAFIGNENCVPFLLEGLHILETRGYDSAGISTLAQNEICTTKFASNSTTNNAHVRLKESIKVHENQPIGIAHTRWATHGAKTDTNAHPHSDSKNRIALVHNGVIQNYNELKKKLEEKGITFASQTDTEVIAQLIGMYLDNGLDVIEAVKASQKQLVGTWGCVILAKELPDKLIAMKNGSPLLIGIDKERTFIASEPSAFSRYTKDYISLQDMEVAIVGPGNGNVSLDLSRVEKSTIEDFPLSPEPYQYWTLKEIMEQPIAIANAINFGGRILDDLNVKLGGLDNAEDKFEKARNLVVSACGTSLFAGRFGVGIMQRLRAFDTAVAIDAAELSSENFPLTNPCLLVISQSGETKDVHRAATLAIDLNIPVFSIVNVVGSLIARTTGCGIYCNAGREVAVASTKAFSSQIVCLCLGALWFSGKRNDPKVTDVRKDLILSIQRLSTVFGMTLQCHNKIKPIAKRIVDGNSSSIFVLGKGLAEPVAKEGALKIKEITYIHAEGYAGGALKHGPFALIEQNTPIILIIPDDNQAPFMTIAVAEVKSRGAFTIVITDNPVLGTEADEVIVIPSNGLLTALIAVVPIQLLAFEMAVLRGNNPDKPRNLAKAVTVD